MDLDESVPALRKTSEGLVEYIRIGNLLHKKILHEESILGNRISPGINDQAKAIVFTVDNDGAFLNGILGTHGYATRAGTTGSDTSPNAFNFEWDGTYLDGYIDTTEVWPNETSDYRIKENIENIGEIDATVIAEVEALVEQNPKDLEQQLTSLIENEFRKLIISGMGPISQVKVGVNEEGKPIYKVEVSDE